MKSFLFQIIANFKRSAERKRRKTESKRTKQNAIITMKHFHILWND